MAVFRTNEEAVAHVMKYKAQYYTIFSVDRSASADEIKRAYKKLAVRCHPDKNPGSARAVEAFKLLSKANDVLTDRTKRAAYDRGGESGVLHAESGSSPQAQRGGGGYGHRQQRYGRNPQDEFEDFVYNMFGGGRRPGGQQQQGRQQGGTEFEGNVGMLMLIPLILFILMASMLQSNLFDGGSNNMQRGSRGRNGMGGRAGGARVQAFRLVNVPQEGFTMPRVTNVRGYSDLRVEYFVRQDFDNMLMSGNVDLYNTEMNVLREKRESLQRRCTAENLRGRSQGKADNSAKVCQDFRKYQRVPNS